MALLRGSETSARSRNSSSSKACFCNEWILIAPAVFPSAVMGIDTKLLTPKLLAAGWIYES
jgi:hypothetical protein